jgi:uncharacterized membrane protein YdfJ with MMPL/SSD domain
VTFAAAPLDRPTRFVSAAVTAALAGLALSIANVDGFAPGGVVAGVAVALVAAAYGFGPAAYRVDGATLAVRRRWFGSVAFTVEHAARLPWQFGVGGIRVAGSGGAFGWYGRFWRRDVGFYRAYVTDRSRLVGCQTSAGLVVVSPAEPDAFLAALP